MFFFFKQKAAYEVLISDWSSDVCSSDLIRHGQSAWNLENRFTGWWDVDLTDLGAREAKEAGELMAARGLDFDLCFTSVQTRAIKRSEERRVGKACVRTCRYRWSPSH